MWGSSLRSAPTPRGAGQAIEFGVSGRAGAGHTIDDGVEPDCEPVEG